jgi:hypothetical protein
VHSQLFIIKIDHLKSYLKSPKKDVSPEAREVFEQLTGWEYEKSWGNNKIGYENLIKYKEIHNKTAV